MGTLKDIDVLDLPEAPNFISEPPCFSAAEMAALCEKMLPYWNTIRYSKPEPEFVGEAFALFGDIEPPAAGSR